MQPDPLRMRSKNVASSFFSLSAVFSVWRKSELFWFKNSFQQKCSSHLCFLPSVGLKVRRLLKIYSMWTGSVYNQLLPCYLVGIVVEKIEPGWYVKN